MSVFSAIGHYFVGLLKALGGQLAVKVEDFLRQFVVEDVGKLAIDAVNYVEATLPGADGTTKRDAAVAQLKTDLAAAGHDVSTFALSTLNWLVETALQAVTEGIAKVPVSK